MKRTGERRTATRVPVEMWVEQSSDAGLYFQRSGNLSVGGIRLERSIPQALGTVLQLQFTLPGQTERLRVRGEVVNVSRGRLGMGIKFLDPDPPTRERIAAWIEQAAARAAVPLVETASAEATLGEPVARDATSPDGPTEGQM